MKLKKVNMPGLPIQGKTLVACVDSYFWYFWGDRAFDIRSVRKAACMKKNVYASDTYRNRCKAFETVFLQLENISDFSALLDKADLI